MHEMNAGAGCFVAQCEPWMRCVSWQSASRAVESRCKQNRTEEGNRDDDAANGWSGTLRHGPDNIPLFAIATCFKG
jgi:hypothetical protein